MIDHFTRARHNLGLIALDQAAEWARKRGYMWVGTWTAPETLEGLYDAHEESSRTGKPFPVSLEHSEDTIYMAGHINVAWRFWHDQLHIEHGHNMTMQGELMLAARHLQAVADIHGTASIEYLLAQADTEGQIRYCAEHGHFPRNQLWFVQCYVAGMPYKDLL